MAQAAEHLEREGYEDNKTEPLQSPICTIVIIFLIISCQHLSASPNSNLQKSRHVYDGWLLLLLLLVVVLAVVLFFA